MIAIEVAIAILLVCVVLALAGCIAESLHERDRYDGKSYRGWRNPYDY